MNRRDLLLQQMGIDQWQLRRPNTLKGVVNTEVPNNVRLVVIAERAIESADKFLQDFLRALGLSESDCLLTDFDQAQHLTIRHSVNYWILGENDEKFDRTLAQLTMQSPQIWRSVSLAELKNSAQQKRELWRQIQQLPNSNALNA